ncbi:hypothetical protein TWF730_003713 [Orbilia blumenaviensis]|uniref:Uncharacterized protein n=1 Tax=Orbilia blumenaviensis TaxID=1796055 RepID=A0AAV9U645_9PEZI
MCGTDGIPYQCGLYTDNTCGNGNTEHTNETTHGTVTPDISNAYKIVFSDPDNQWVKASWDDEDQEQVIRSYECIPSTSSAYGVFIKGGQGTTIGGVSGTGGSATTDGINVISETATVCAWELLPLYQVNSFG